MCSLAYIKVHRASDNEVGKEAAEHVQSVALDHVTDAMVVEQVGEQLKIVLWEKGEKDWNKSVNCQLLENGLAMMEKGEEGQDWPEEVNDWFTFEEEAKEQQLKIWQYGEGGFDDDE